MRQLYLTMGCLWLSREFCPQVAQLAKQSLHILGIEPIAQQDSETINNAVQNQLLNEQFLVYSLFVRAR